MKLRVDKKKNRIRQIYANTEHTESKLECYKFVERRYIFYHHVLHCIFTGLNMTNEEKKSALRCCIQQIEVMNKVHTQLEKNNNGVSSVHGQRKVEFASIIKLKTGSEWNYGLVIRTTEI